MFGADPEFFFKKKSGGVVGAEKVIPPNGFMLPLKYVGVGGVTAGAGVSHVIIDGVQAELNPRPNSSRKGLAREIGATLKSMKDGLLDADISADFSQAVTLTQKEMDSLSDKYKVFGCSPSRNVYVPGGISRICVDPKVYTGRSAGGHIHIGTAKDDDGQVKWALKRPRVMVPLFDLIVGNTCVLIDRDASNIERRKVYGKAGEHRTPKYGIEYRTPSNFWLHSPELMDLVFGLARHAVVVGANSTENNDAIKALFKNVKLKEVERAINDNDVELAQHNFNSIKDALLEMTPRTEAFPINKDTISLFERFIKRDIKSWFDEPPMDRWSSLGDCTDDRVSFVSFLKNKVTN